VQTCARLQPALVCVSAMNARTAQTLIATVEAINQLPQPRPMVAFGGAPFNVDVALRAQVHGQFLGVDAQESVARIEELLN